jgi:hypothetical protein
MSNFDETKHTRNGQAGNPGHPGQFAAQDRAEASTVLTAPDPSLGLTKPRGYEGEYVLTPARLWLDNRMESRETMYNPDPTGARCDYAEVGEEGIAYGYDLPANLVGAIVAGEPETDESDSDYAERVDKALTAEDYATIDRYFATEYGADKQDSGDYGDFALEFFVEYGPEGIDGTSTEAMGDRAEHETKLLQARNDFEGGGNMQSGLAKALGYHVEGIFDGDSNWVGSKFVKDEA